MAIRQVVVWPDERLRQETRPVGEIDDAVRQLYRDLCDTMYDENGLGIAAIQIGEPVRMFLVEPKLAGRDPNELRWRSSTRRWSGRARRRSSRTRLPVVPGRLRPGRAADARPDPRDGHRRPDLRVEGEGLLARCLLHEYDHLTGKLLVDFVGPLKRQMIKRKLQKVRDAAG